MIAIKGTRDLARRLDALPRSMRNKILRPAVTAASRPMRAAAKANVGSGGTRELAKSVDLKVKTGKLTVYAVIGPRSDSESIRPNLFGKPVKYRPAKIAHLVEGGSAPHVIMVGRGRRAMWQHPGTRASHFMARAWQSTSGSSQRTIEAKIREGLTKHA